MSAEPQGRLVAYVGSYGAAPGSPGGGVYAFAVSPAGDDIAPIDHAPEPKDAGYLVYAADTGTLYAVDERKTDGRGPVHPPASVHALSVDRADGRLTWLNARRAPGPRPTFLSHHAGRRLLLCANHGDFAHIERVVRTPDGGWDVDYAYDDSTVLLYELEPDGRVGRLRDVQVLAGHGRDPNGSPQNGGHAQSSPHAHCAVLDPSGAFALVGDKGTDRILVYRVGDRLEPVSDLRFEEETAPRHIAFDPETGLAFATLELSSEVVAMAFDPATGTLTVLDRRSTLRAGHVGVNEPAEIRVHPRGRLVYVNNRGEDTLAWFAVGEGGRLSRRGDVPLARSVHPGLAARSFAFDPAGAFVLVADRPAHLVRSYAVDAETGGLRPIAEIAVPDPACVAFATLERRDPSR